MTSSVATPPRIASQLATLGRDWGNGENSAHEILLENLPVAVYEAADPPDFKN